MAYRTLDWQQKMSASNPSVLRAIFFSSMEKYYGITVAFVTTIVISRLLSPADVGAFSVAMSLAGVASVLREFGATNFLIRSPSIDAKHLSCAFGISLLLGWSIGMLLLIAASPLALFFAHPQLQALLWVLSLNFFLLPFGTVNFALIQRAMHFELSARIGLIATTLSATIAMGLAWLGYGAFSLAWAAVALAATTAGLSILWGPGTIMVRPRLHGATEVLSFGSKSTALTLIWEVSARLPEFMAGKFLGFSAAGLLSRASGLATNLNDLLQKGLQPVVLPYFARIKRDGGNLVESHYRIATLLCGAGWPAFAVLAVAAEPLTTILYGSQWLGIVPPVQIICIQMAYSLLFSYQLQVVMVKDAMSQQLRASLLTFPVRLALIAYGATLGINEVCAAMLLSQLIGTLIARKVVFPSIEVTLPRYLRVARTSLPLGISAILGSLTGDWLARAWMPGALPELLCIVGLGFSAPIATAYFLRHPLRSELENIIRRKWAPHK